VSTGAAGQGDTGRDVLADRLLLGEQGFGDGLDDLQAVLADPVAISGPGSVHDGVAVPHNNVHGAGLDAQFQQDRAGQPGDAERHFWWNPSWWWSRRRVVRDASGRWGPSAHWRHASSGLSPTGPA
jgi:hypothetical protein